MPNYPKWDNRAKAQVDSKRRAVLDAVIAKPGIQAKELALTKREYLRQLEIRGLITYRDGGWYPVNQDAVK